MKTKTWLPIALALVLGVFAAVLAKRAMSSQKAAVPGTVKLVVAQRSIAPGDALTAADLELRTVAGNAMPEGAHADASALIGRAAQTQIAKDKPVLESMLAPQGSPTGLQALVPPGMRAMTIEVNEFSSVGGMVTPGARVDIITTMQNPRHSESMSRTIAQNVLVKAVGKETGAANETNEDAKPAKSVTLLVTSKQAEAIQLASLSGRPWLVLRGGTDSSIASLSGTTLAELRGAAPDMARDIITALRNVRATRANATVTSAQRPATQPVAVQPTTWAPTRAVHTIRNTVESTISVSPVTPQLETVTGAEIEP